MDSTTLVIVVAVVVALVIPLVWFLMQMFGPGEDQQ